MIYVYDMLFHIQVIYRKSTELRDSHSRVEKDIEHFVVFAVHVIVTDEFQKSVHLRLGYCLPCMLGIDNDTEQLKIERILEKNIIIHSHLKSRS